jgi:hypothetical protein
VSNKWPLSEKETVAPVVRSVTATAPWPGAGVTTAWTAEVKAAGASAGDVVGAAVGACEDVAEEAELEADAEAAPVGAAPAPAAEEFDWLTTTTIPAAMTVTATVAMPNRKAELRRGARL